MNDLKRYGEWALITGASAGIGKAFAEAIAAQGLNCVLVARRLDRLQELAGELQSRHGVECRCVKEDLADPASAQRVADAVGDLEVGLLVNNAGFGYAWRFEDSEPARMADMITLNCLTPALLTRLLVPGMVKRRNGGIILVGSVLGVIPSPYQSVYGATKAFDVALAESLFGEYETSGIDVLALCPSTTRTEFFVADGMSEARAKRITAWADRPEDVAGLALRYLGRKSRVGPWAYVGPALLARVLPRKWSIRLVRRFMKPYLRKDEGVP
ncbi:MAG TPA: SDR family oxidoreductase [Candidatus Hydrogenedentes bacterium]|jgi:short-subunit dehydrogenase|nr:SDR family oxidoreductase [Candidatus Hydrogenedentota bacterium]MDY0034193.1 SDR family oxidoreductase [FCB group bacterium]NLT62367.1 SDR family oxidoreductase [Candidatus Hydrogenedentota bacterium]HNV20947.1 SDR family oxidoreductase [Candidatus Hydrogenedentota bacterium]HNZ19585.1 SDR family oxidoreductase [Candidatus Hydrogenedentota bacterium]